LSGLQEESLQRLGLGATLYLDNVTLANPQLREKQDCLGRGPE
jgi:hypothetical protein